MYIFLNLYEEYYLIELIYQKNPKHVRKYNYKFRTSSKCIASFLQIPQSSIIVVRVKPDVVIIMYHDNLKKSGNILK